LSGLTLAENNDYETCKKTILNYFRLDADQYLKLFRTARREPAETSKMFRARMSDFLCYYLDARNITSFDALRDVLLQQFVGTLSPEVRNFVVARQPKSADEASNLADVQTQMTRDTAGTASQAAGVGYTPFQKRANGPPPAQTQQAYGIKGNGTNKPLNKRPACYTCGSVEHKRALCPL